MTYAADLHLHSRFAYATSKNLTLEALACWAELKGIDLLAAADFTHPIWRKELEDKLTPEPNGLYSFGGRSFVLGTEVSCVYRQGGRGRRVHILLFAPDFAAVDKLCRALVVGGSNLESDGRPTLALSARDLTALVMDIDPRCLVVPAHVWTPWFGLYGSKSGFDTLEECFLDMTSCINAVETGLSSDPAMNWNITGLSDKSIVSFSDAHSPAKMGRELTIFEGDLSYSGLAGALEHQKVAYTVEFYPEEGKYHYSGHRKCGVSMSPEETSRNGDRCSVCHRPLTLGVLHRVDKLSQGESWESRGPDGFVHGQHSRPRFIRLVPLVDIIAETLGRGPSTKAVQREYFRIVKELGSELQVLAWAGEDDLVKAGGERLAAGILKARTGGAVIEPGYDGLYGKVRIWPDEEGQLNLL